MRISDWSSDVCSSDLPARAAHAELAVALGVAVAEGDRVEVVPDPQQVRRLAGADEARHARVGVLGGGGDAVHVCLVDLARAEKQLAVGGPLDVTPPHIGTASCRDSGCTYGLCPVEAGRLKKNT